jgi:hypothetical protein
LSNLLGVIQEIMQENQKAMKPTEVAFGTVATVSPLSILNLTAQAGGWTDPHRICNPEDCSGAGRRRRNRCNQ